MKFIDSFLNNITMYRLVLYYLIFLLFIGYVLSLIKVLPVDFSDLLFSSVFIILTCYLVDKFFSRIFKIVTNFESVFITALILSLIITPTDDFYGFVRLVLIGFLAISSKYIIAINRKHIFNPAAFAVFASALIFNEFANWWIGNTFMMPFVLFGGLLIIRKIKRFDLILSFFFVSLITITGSSMLKGDDLYFTIKQAIFGSEMLFFALVMLTEPQTTPPNARFRIFYASLIGFLFGVQTHIGSFYTTAEFALVAGNIFSFIVSPKEKLILKLKEKIRIAPDIYDFVFNLDKKMQYKSGQYMEWTLKVKGIDGRGNRRFFTLASSPTENNLRIGIKFYPNGSSFKNVLNEMKNGDEIVASGLSGEFILPQEKDKKLVFLAGGIGITPFRSMVKYLIDQNQKRDIILFYSNKAKTDIVYEDVFDEAFDKLGIKTIYVNTDTSGYIDEKMIKDYVYDFHERIFYISGSHSMVDAFKEILNKLDVKDSNIKIDFFPGYA